MKTLKQKLLTICREIYEHKITWGTGHRKILKLFKEYTEVEIIGNVDSATGTVHFYDKPKNLKIKKGNKKDDSSTNSKKK